MTDFAAARRNMVDGTIRTADVTDLRLLRAFQETPRERFVPAKSAELAYVDFDLPVAAHRFLMQPRLLSKMLQVADIKATDRVLVVGSATGYGAAILSRIAAQVVALEEDAELARAAREALADRTNVEVVSGSLAAGCTASAPFDVIVVEGAGGLLVPLTPTLHIGDLFRHWHLELIIVSGNRLGTVNHTLLTIDAARALGLTVRAVVLNTLASTDDPIARETNQALIAELRDVPIYVFPYLSGATSEAQHRAAGRDLVEWLRTI